MTLMQGLTIGGARGATGTGAVGVPLVVGRTRVDAEAALANLGLTPRVEELETIGTVGDVYGQDPMPPAKRFKGAVVTLQIIKVPVIPPDLGTKLDQLNTLTTKIGTDLTALAAIAAAAETDAAAASRQQELSDKLTEVIDKLKDIEDKRGQAVGKKSP
jgi:beta-lactam-binding protein with PASTA domain